MGKYFNGVLKAPMIPNRICFFEDIRSINSVDIITDRIKTNKINKKDHYRVKTLNGNREEIDLFIYSTLLNLIYNINVNMNMDNSLITGGSGMVGSNFNFGIKPSSKKLDITNMNSVLKYIEHNQNISCIIHLAATNLRDSENDIIKAIDININGTTNMLKIAKKLNIPFVLVSSGAVFSSENMNEKFDEDHKPCPNSNYGHTKLASENIALLYEKTIIVRTGWLFGGNQKTHYKFVETVINNLIINKEIKASNDFFGSPTYVMDIIEHIKFLINNLHFGIHHVVNTDFASGYDIALELAKIMNKDINLINSVPSTMVPNSGPKEVLLKC